MAPPGPSHGAPHSERPASRLPREGRDDDREGRRREDRATDALHRSGGGEPRGGLREATHQARHGEQDEAEEEHPTPAEEVGGAPAEEQEAREREDVGVDDPLQAGRRCSGGPGR